MVHATRAALVACLVGLAAPALAGSLSTLQDTARRCFETGAASACDAVWDLSDPLKQQADSRGQLRCYTALLALEANVSKLKRGSQDPLHQAQALQDISLYCQ